MSLQTRIKALEQSATGDEVPCPACMTEPLSFTLNIGPPPPNADVAGVEQTEDFETQCGACRRPLTIRMRYISREPTKQS